MKKIVCLALLLVSPFAFAIDVGSDVTVATLANAFIESLEYIPNIFSALSYVAGVVFGIKAALKFKEHNESKGQVKLVTPIMFLVASALFLGLPVVLDIGITTMGYQKTAQKEWKF